MILQRCRIVGISLSHFCRDSVRLFSEKLSQNKSVMRILNVAEKNDAAKNISNFLSRETSRRREGLSKFNKIYEFDYTFNGQQATMVMTSVSGHLLNYAFTDMHKKWYSCSPEDLFEAPVIKVCLEDYQPILNTIKREVRTCNVLIIWTDCDREGENIGFEIINVCREVKPGIQVFRAKFSEITMQSVKNAMNRLEQPKKLISDAVDVRSELDLRIGAAFTRFQTLRLKRVFPEALGDSLISYGSCQFPTMGFVVQRYKEVQDFIPEQFWKLKVLHTMNNLTVEFLWKRVRLFDELCCQVLHDRCTDEPLARVENQETKPKSKWRPVPLDTIELEKAANRYLKLSAKETMKIAERLYSQGFVSYPRTETNIFPPSMDLLALIRDHTNDNRWGQFAGQVLQDGVNPRQGKKSDQAHPPIHPTKHTDGLTGNDRKVYEFIVRRFLACVSKDAEGMETVVKIDIHGEKFVASGLQILAENYLAVYPYDKWSDKAIHMYQPGQTFTPTSIDMVEGQTTAPNLLTEAELIALMDRHGIGTDATHADHIDKIQERMYVGLIDERYFTPGELGIGLVDGYDSMGFEMSKPYLRAELESDLKKICEGTKDPKVALQEQIRKYRDVFRKTVEQANKLDVALSKYLKSQPQAVENSIARPAQDLVQKCSSCGAGMILKHRQSKPSFLSCNGYPNCRNGIWFPSKVLEVHLTDNTCAQCGPDVRLLKFKFRAGSMEPFYRDEHVGCVNGCDEEFMKMLEIFRSVRRDPGDVAMSNRTGNTTYPNNLSTESGYQSIDRTANESFNNQRNNRHWGPNTSDFHADDSGWSSNNADRSNEQRRNQWGDDSNDFNRPAYNQRNYNTGTNNASSSYQWRNSSGDQRTNNSMNINVPMSNQWTNNSGGFNASGGSQWRNNSGTNPAGNQWNNNAGGYNAPGNSQRGSNTGDNDDNAEDKQCNCGVTARRYTVQKESVNKGRQFYGCSKSMSEPGRCQFFCWADAGPSSTNTAQTQSNNSGWNSNSYRNQNNYQNRNTSFRAKKKTNTNRTTSERKCGNCRQAGHTRNNCPLNNETDSYSQ